MTTIREFIEKDPLGTADAEAKYSDGLAFFGSYLPTSMEPQWPRVLSKFTNKVPLRYWDDEIIGKALAILESNRPRTTEALGYWKNRIGIGFDYLLRRAAVEKFEDDLSSSDASDLIQLANEFHPEYLRRCEYIFTNLIILYWAVSKKGAVTGNFDITGALSVIKKKGYDFLLSGYDEKVRNGIAHGQVILSWPGIIYGESAHPYKLQDDEFLFLFDNIWRTANSLAIAILLFLARDHLRFPHTSNILPTAIIYLAAASETDRIGLSIKGMIESEMKLGHQLHILIETIFKKREAILLECARIALHLLDAGAVGYSRFLFEISTGTKVKSMVVILPRKLAELKNESMSRFPEIMESPLIWTDESQIQFHAKILKVAFLSTLKLGITKYISEQQAKGLFPTTNRYYIKRVDNNSAGGLARVHVFVTLRFPSDATDREIVKKIILAVVRKFRGKRFPINSSKLVKRRLNWYKRPMYIMVSLYQYEGTKRWVVYGGWLQKNLIAQAERLFSTKAQPVFVKKVEELWHGIRLQYSMDIEAAARSYAEISKLANKVN